jgi:acylglycerol lipase
MQHFEFTMQAADGQKLYGQGWAPDGAPKAAISFVHGLGEHSGRYAHVATNLTSAGYALVAFDLRGHGRSEGKRGHAASYDMLMDDIGLLLQETETRYPGGRSYFLYGHSLGGNLVLNYVLRRKPDLAGVIATSPALRTTTPLPGWKRGLAGLLYDRLPDLQMPNGLDLSGLSHDPDVIARYQADPLVHDRASVRLGADVLTTGEWALNHAANFPLPLLLMHGSADRLTCPKTSAKFASEVNDCTFVLMDGCYHELHNEPESHEVLDNMVAWLDRHTVDYQVTIEPGEYAS